MARGAGLVRLVRRFGAEAEVEAGLGVGGSTGAPGVASRLRRPSSEKRAEDPLATLCRRVERSIAGTPAPTQAVTTAHRSTDGFIRLHPFLKLLKRVSGDPRPPRATVDQSACGMPRHQIHRTRQGGQADAMPQALLAWVRVPSIGGWGRMRWTEGLLVPERVWLRATSGRAGARAARLLYRQRRHRALAWVASEGRSLALTYGIGRRCEPPVDGFDELCDLVGVAPAGAAAIHSWLADRVVLYIVGRPASLVVKVGARQDAGLATETELLGRL